MSKKHVQENDNNNRLPTEDYEEKINELNKWFQENPQLPKEIGKKFW